MHSFTTSSIVTSFMVGGINERGYINGLERRGYTPAKCILELFGNSVDAIKKFRLSPLCRDYQGKICTQITRSTISIIDNGYGMGVTELNYMFDLHRENHANDYSCGVSGIGAKPAMFILGKKTRVLVYTRILDGDYLCAEVPWDAIYREGKYTSMIQVRAMTDAEKEEFLQERGNAHGTSIRFLYNDELKSILQENFESIDTPENDLKDPRDRIANVFGKMDIDMFYKHYEGEKKMNFYNYFSGNQADYYLGKDTETLIHYYNASRDEHRFLWERMEIPKSGRGYGNELVPVTHGLAEFQRVGVYTLSVGLRIDPELFDPENPRTASADTVVGAYNLPFLGKKPNTTFLTYNKLFRNSQLIGYIHPEVSIGSARANGFSKLFIEQVQCEVSYSPCSSQNNHQDRIMQIQENKNQHDSGSLPKQFTRLIREIKKRKANSIWEYMERLRGPEPVPAPAAPAPAAPEPAPAAPDVPDVPAPAPAVPAPEPTPAPDPEPEPTPAPAAPAPTDVNAYRRGAVFGHELRIAMETLLETIDDTASYNGSDWIELYNKLLYITRNA